MIKPKEFDLCDYGYNAQRHPKIGIGYGSIPISISGHFAWVHAYAASNKRQSANAIF